MNKICTKHICIISLVCAFIYGLALPFFWGNDPTQPTGTLSLLCENRQVYFWVWGILVVGSLILNVQYMYKKFDYKNRFLDAICLLAFLSMCLVALTLGHSIEDWNPKRLLHWVATGFFIACCIAAIALFFIFNIKKYKHFKLFTAVFFVIPVTFALLFAVMGKSAIMEMVPLAMMKVFLFVVNFTPAVRPELLNKGEQSELVFNTD